MILVFKFFFFFYKPLNEFKWVMRAQMWGKKTKLSSRLFATVLVRFVIMTSLNMWVLLTVLHYQKQGSRSKKDD